MKLLLIRPYYGLSVNSDMCGDLGITEFQNQIFPDVSFVFSATIASQANNVDLDIIDANAEKIMPNEIKDRLQKDYDYIIMKVCAPTIQFDLELCSYLNQRYSHAQIVLSGHIVVLLQEWLRNNYADYNLIINESIESYIYHLTGGKKDKFTLSDFPTLDYSLVPYNKYEEVGGNIRGCLYLSRGCNSKCSYCPYTNFYNHIIEYRDVDKVISDIEGMCSLGITTIQFRDQFFTSSKKKVIELCNKIIDRKLNIKWRCETRLESIDNEMIDLMKKAGLELICFGVESASKETLENYSRNSYNREKLLETINYLNKNNIITVAFYIIGFPEDTWDSIEATFKCSLEMNTSHVKFSIFYPYEEIKKNQKTITPNIFLPFEENVNMTCRTNLNQYELEFSRDYMTLNYSIMKHGYKDTYYYVYKDMLIYNQKLKTLRKVKKDIWHL